jgi:hypothetical protein
MSVKRTGDLDSGAARSRGQGLTEFALVAPLLFLLIFGIIESGRLIYYYHSLNHGVREGTRHAIVHGSNALDGCPSGPPAPSSYACDPSAENVRGAVRDAAFSLDPANLDIDVCHFGGAECGQLPTNARGANVTVTATYTYEPIVSLFPSITISAESTLVINN